MCLPMPSSTTDQEKWLPTFICWSKSKLHQQQLPLKTRRLICQHPLECNFGIRGNNNTCQMGDCDGSLYYAQAQENQQNILGEQDYYDASLVGCFNLLMVVMPLGGKQECKAAGCDGDLRDRCPENMTVKESDGKTIGYQSACEAFSSDEYCCRGMYGSPVSCQATKYATTFKQVFPVAYSYTYHDPTSLGLCAWS